MNIINYISTGYIEKIHLGMSLDDFNETKLSIKVTDTIYLCEEIKNDEFIYYTHCGIEISFTFDKISSISIDPSINNLKIGKLKIDRHLRLSDLITCYYANNILWKFKHRNYGNECEVITSSGVSVIFTFDEDEFWISKFRLNKNNFWK